MDVQDSNIHEMPKKHRGIAHYMPFLGALAAGALRILHRSCRFQIVNEDNYRTSLTFQPRIAAFWHFCYPSILYFFRDNGYLTITSRSRDGELAAGLVRSLGYVPFRGSPGKGGVSALKGIISVYRSGRGGGFGADGSQGPARIAQKGLLLLSMYSGCSIMPVSVAADRCWRFRTWDRTLLPKPFARIGIAFGPMIKVEKGCSAEKLEEYRIQLERVLNEITGQAERAVGGVCIKQ